MNFSTILSHVTPVQWASILLPLLAVLIGLVRWIDQRGKPRTPPTYRQGCLSGLFAGLWIGILIGLGIAFAVQLYSTRFK